MTVVSADFVPIIPYTTDYLSIGIGQRYDVIIEANATVNNYWFRATVQTTCSASNPQVLNIKGIVRYFGATNTSDPTSTVGTMSDSCLDEPLASLVPVVAKSVASSDLSTAQEVEVSIAVTTVFKWTLNGISVQIDWANPTLMMLLESEVYPTDYHVLPLPNANQMYYLVIETSLGITHPIHLHGHDFYVLAQDSGPFNASATSINWTNPMRRDVAMLPAAGHLVIAFETDNPGIWLMHCHIAWHISGGFGLQFVERASDILTDITINSSWDDTCTAWGTYSTSGIEPPQQDSGLRKMRH
jgi:FtsP/CotA-like multicopper oxidase with cupredoxin domain